eukprot:gene42502-29438_t
MVFDGPGGHSALPAGGYYIVDAWMKPAQGDKVTRENLDGFLRAAAARAIMQRAILSAAALPPLDPQRSFVVGLRAASDIGAAVCFRDFVARSEEDRRARAGVVQAHASPAPPGGAPAPAPPGGNKALVLHEDVEERRRLEEDTARAAAAK